MRHPLLFLIGIVCSQPAFAENPDSMHIAENLATVLAAEQLCGFTYDQQAIKAFIDSHVPSDDMDFSNFLNLFVSGYAVEIQSMSPSQKTAMCVQTQRVARSYHFIH